MTRSTFQTDVAHRSRVAGRSPTGARIAAALAGLALMLATAAATALEPFSADYQAKYMGLSANGKMTIEAQGGNRWKYTLRIVHQAAQLTQTTVFEDNDGSWRPLTGTDASLLLIKKIRRNAVYDWGKNEARWSGDVKPERAGPVKLQAGDVDGLLMNLAIPRDVAAGKPLRYRLVDEGRVKNLQFTAAGKDNVTIDGKPREASKWVNSNGNKQMTIWVVEGLALPARILQRKDGKDDIDLKIVSVK
jgi:Protein of unknown function (DUF3108)